MCHIHFCTFLIVICVFPDIIHSLQQCTSHFCPPVLEKSKITWSSLGRELPLKYVDEDLNSGCLCRELPQEYTLCFNYDDETIPCVKFPKRVQMRTKSLLLKSTFITQIVKGDFEKLSHLDTLTLDGNQKLNYIQSFVFENMTNLTYLSFIFNPSLKHLEPNTFYGLVNLRELNLVKNGFHNIEVLTENLSPDILPELNKLNLNENIFRIINEQDFEPMRNSSLEELNMILCGIDWIHPNALIPLENLQALRIGENRFNFSTLYNLLNSTIDSGINLKVLDLYSSGFRAYVPKIFLELIAKSNISSLVLARNQLDAIDNETFPVALPNLIQLDLSDVSAQTIGDQAFSNFPNLKTLILAKNRLSYFAASKFLPNLTYLDLQENTDKYGWEFFLTRSEFRWMSLEYLDLQYTRLILLTKTDFGVLPHLRILNMKNCSIINIEPTTFKGLKNLKHLNMENNRIFEVWIRFPFDIFEGLEGLEELLMGGNDISVISTTSNYLFKHLKMLKHLGLNRNSIQSISAKDFQSLTHLEVLDISENHLLIWQSRVFLHNNNLKEFHASINKLTYLTNAMLEDFQNLTLIELYYNSFVCNCRKKMIMSSNKTLMSKFVNLIEGKNITCVNSPNITLLNFVKSVRDSTLICVKEKNILIFIIPSVILLVSIVFLSILGYVYRWHIRYWVFLLRLYLIRRGKMRNTKINGSGNYQFDAFVSYCNQDRNFVIKLVGMLENLPPFLKLCVYERDFQIGSMISESVLEHINKSRKTLLIVSNSYAKSYWCTWETQIAEHHRLFYEKPNGECVDDSIVLIKLGSIKEPNLSPILKYLLKTRVYLQWQSDEDKQKVFWQKLRQFLSPTHSNISSENNQS